MTELIGHSQSKYDFDSMGPYLFGALLVFFVTGIVGIFIPYSRTLDIVIACGGCLLFRRVLLARPAFITDLLHNRIQRVHHLRHPLADEASPH